VRYKLGFYIPDDGIPLSHRREYLKSYEHYIVCMRRNFVWYVYLCLVYCCGSLTLVKIPFAVQINNNSNKLYYYILRNVLIITENLIAITANYVSTIFSQLLRYYYHSKDMLTASVA
jgi:hypothetical protein